MLIVPSASAQSYVKPVTKTATAASTASDASAASSPSSPPNRGLLPVTAVQEFSASLNASLIGSVSAQNPTLSLLNLQSRLEAYRIGYAPQARASLYA